jgi:hypothetical protein
LLPNEILMMGRTPLEIIEPIRELQARSGAFVTRAWFTE